MRLYTLILLFGIAPLCAAEPAKPQTEEVDPPEEDSAEKVPSEETQEEETQEQQEEEESQGPTREEQLQEIDVQGGGG